MLKKLLIGLLIVCLIAGGIIIMMMIINGRKYRNDTLKSVSVSTGGGMLGGHRGAELRREKDGSVVLKISRRETHADREETTTYRVDEKAFDELHEIIQKYQLYRASKRPYSKMQVMDGDTTSLSVSYTKGSFSISDNQVLSRKMKEGFGKAEAYLYSLANGEGVVTREPQTALLYLKSGYTLQYQVEEAFDGKLDELLSEEREVSRYEDCGIILVKEEGTALQDIMKEVISPEKTEEPAAETVTSAAAGAMIYDPESGSVMLLYEDHEFKEPVYILAWGRSDPSSAGPLIREMEGPYRLFLN